MLASLAWGDHGYWVRVALAGLMLAGAHFVAAGRLSHLGAGIGGANSPAKFEGASARQDDCEVEAVEPGRVLLRENYVRAWAHGPTEGLEVGQRVGVVGIWRGGEIVGATFRPTTHVPWVRAAWAATVVVAALLALAMLSRHYRWAVGRGLLE